jgi:hypothetical protein
MFESDRWNTLNQLTNITKRWRRHLANWKPFKFQTLYQRCIEIKILFVVLLHLLGIIFTLFVILLQKNWNKKSVIGRNRGFSSPRDIGVHLELRLIFDMIAQSVTLAALRKNVLQAYLKPFYTSWNVGSLTDEVLSLPKCQ